MFNKVFNLVLQMYNAATISNMLRNNLEATDFFYSSNNIIVDFAYPHAKIISKF